MPFKEIDNKLWEKIEPYLPPQKPITGRPRADLRKTFNGILYVLYSGCRWEEVPEKYGAKSTVHRLHLKLAREGVYSKISEILLSDGYYTGKINLEKCLIDTKDILAKKGAK